MVPWYQSKHHQKSSMMEITRRTSLTVQTSDSVTLPISDSKISVASGKQKLQKLASGLLPSFVHNMTPNQSKSQRLHPTSYLDGLRGVASFIVFMGHYTEENLGWYEEPYGLFEDGARSSPLQLPFLRIIYSSRPMVHIFFIISGFVLSYKPLQQIHRQKFSALSTTLSSSIFRRGFRLFLPSFLSIFMMAISVYFGVSDQRYSEPYADLYGQLRHAGQVCGKLWQSAWVMDNDLNFPHPEYNPALWTIPIEFSMSLLLFIVLLGLSRCLAHLRLLLLTGVMWFCFASGHLYALEFIGGLLIAELTLIQDRSLISPSNSPTILPKFDFSAEDQAGGKSGDGCSIVQKLVQGFWIANVVVGLWISSWTNKHVEGIWGLSFLNSHTPAPYEGQRVWFCFAAFQIVAACTQLTWLQNIFNTGIAQYLGNISYALYLTHNLCLTTLEPRFIPILNRLFGKESFSGRHLFWAGGLLIYLPIIISVADLFWRMADVPAVKFSRWLETKCITERKPWISGDGDL